MGCLAHASTNAGDATKPTKHRIRAPPYSAFRGNRNRGCLPAVCYHVTVASGLPKAPQADSKCALHKKGGIAAVKVQVSSPVKCQEQNVMHSHALHLLFSFNETYCRLFLAENILQSGQDSHNINVILTPFSYTNMSCLMKPRIPVQPPRAGHSENVARPCAPSTIGRESCCGTVWAREITTIPTNKVPNTARVE